MLIQQKLPQHTGGLADSLEDSNSPFNKAGAIADNIKVLFQKISVLVPNFYKLFKNIWEVNYRDRPEPAAGEITAIDSRSQRDRSPTAPFVGRRTSATVSVGLAGDPDATPISRIPLWLLEEQVTNQTLFGPGKNLDDVNRQLLQAFQVSDQVNITVMLEKLDAAIITRQRYLNAKIRAGSREIQASSIHHLDQALIKLDAIKSSLLAGPQKFQAKIQGLLIELTDTIKESNKLSGNN
jgi:hypothetical protein